MATNLTEVLAGMTRPEVPIGLEDRILARVRTAVRRGLIIRLASALAGCTAGLAYLALESRALLAAIQQSAAVGILRLAFSDPDIVLGNLQDAALGLVENIPFGAIAFFCALAFAAVCAVELGLALFRQRRRPTAFIPV